jgi:rhamnose utilization protein RhaD (predicted bifunctional aldolase and dehydrogenase)
MMSWLGYTGQDHFFFFFFFFLIFNKKYLYLNLVGIAVNEDEQKRLIKDMGDTKVLFLRNHGILTAGRSLPDAFYAMYTCVKACEMQMYACTSAMTRDKLLIPSDELVAKSQRIAATFSGETTGVLEFSAFMRLLDKEDPSYRN